MRLLTVDANGEYCLESFNDDQNRPPYAILSHTWGTGEHDEVTYEDLINGRGHDKSGFAKLEFCKTRAADDGYRYFWIDTCNINKSASSELNETINSMFRWYQQAAVCYAYLADVATNIRGTQPDGTSSLVPFNQSRWFKRGWTLQELLAPKKVVFFSCDGERLGDKISLRQEISLITGIQETALQNAPLSSFTTEQRFSWGEGRNVTKPEDKAYCMIGILEVSMDPRYGIGEDEAMKRLRRKVYKKSKRLLMDDNTTSSPKRPRLETGDDNRHNRAVTSRDGFLASIHFDQIDARLLNIKGNLKKTCKWLLKNELFVEWLGPDLITKRQGFFWLRGKPGCGKSTLAKFVFTELKKSLKHTKVMSFFFNARGVALEKSTTGLYRSLILQMLEFAPHTYEALKTPYLAQFKDGEAIYDRNALINIMTTLLQKLHNECILIVIDALDECDEDEIRHMVALFQQISEEAFDRHQHLRIFFSSRHYPHISVKNSVDMILEHQLGHSSDMEHYIEKELRRGHIKPVQDIRPKILEKSSAVFLWVVLVVQILNKEIDHGRIHNLDRKLEEIPGDLHRLFRDILARDNHHMEEMKLCLLWVLFAVRPLTRKELYFAMLSAMCTSEDRQPLIPDDVSVEDMDFFILSSSKGLTEVTRAKAQTVQFIHESVRDFLLKDHGLGQVWDEFKSNPVGLGHDHLKDCCARYLKTADFSSIDMPVDLPAAYTSDADRLRTSINAKYPFLSYAVDCLWAHSEQAEIEGIGQKHFITDFDLQQWVYLNNLLEKHQVRRLPDDIDSLYVLAARRCPNLIKYHTDNDGCRSVNARSRFGDPIFVAIANDDEEVFDALLGLDVQQSPSRRRLPYQDSRSAYSLLRQICRDLTASSARSKLICRFLKTYDVPLNLGKSLSRTDKDLFAFFSWACLQNDVHLASILIAKGADTDALCKRHGFSETVLPALSSSGHEMMVSLLLKNGADINACSHSKGTALQAASEGGHATVVSFLLENGANINACGGCYGTALQAASDNGHEKVVSLLLENGADINACGGYYGTALQAASDSGYKKIVSLLLKNGAEINACGGYYGTALQAASDSGHKKVVSLLLKNGADINAFGGYYGTALQAASDSGHKKVVSLLLENGADINARGGRCGTALQAASEGGHDKVVRRLLENGADVNAEGGMRGCALQAAATSPRTDCVRLLLKHGAQIDAFGGEYGCALQAAAASYGSPMEKVKLLLEHGARTDVYGGRYGSALEAAIKTGHDDVAALLRANGAVVRPSESTQ